VGVRQEMNKLNLNKMTHKAGKDIKSREGQTEATERKMFANYLCKTNQRRQK
jgi:hypothetical protein